MKDGKHTSHKYIRTALKSLSIARRHNLMFEKILICTLGIIVAIPVLLWFTIRELFRGGWALLCFICQRQYMELKRLCERGSAAELEAFLAAHPGAKEYIVYTRQDKTTSVITSLFRLPSPLAVAGHANNMAVIPVLLVNGASPEVRSLSNKQSPAEEAIGDPDRMRLLCGGKTWWLDDSIAKDEAMDAAIKACNSRGVIWNILRGARVTSHRQLHCRGFLSLPQVMKKFVCRFGIGERQRREFFSQLKQITAEELKQITTIRIHSPFGPRAIFLHKEFAEMMLVMEKSLQPLPKVDDDAVSRLMFSASLMGRKQMQELLDTLFDLEQQFALLEHLLHSPFEPDKREQTEEAVDLLLCSFLAKADD